MRAPRPFHLHTIEPLPLLPMPPVTQPPVWDIALRVSLAMAGFATVGWGLAML